MSFDNILQYSAKENNCIYFYDDIHSTWKKICDVSLNDLPVSIKNKVQDDQDKAKQVLNIPIK